jgi:hypothetical protein
MMSSNTLGHFNEVTSRRHAASLGKFLTTRVRRLISFATRHDKLASMRGLTRVVHASYRACMPEDTVNCWTVGFSASP